MKPTLAMLGCGSLGYSIASCLDRESLRLTNRHQDIRQRYQSEFPDVSADNRQAAKDADIICLFVRPEQVDYLMAEIAPELDKDCLVVNFAAKGLDLAVPLISVACSPVLEGRIKTLLYRRNSQVTERSFRQFQETFQPVTDHFAECDDPLKELAVMTQVYCHILSYYRLLEGGSDQKALQSYFGLAAETIKTGRIDDVKGAARTKKGLADALFSFHKETLAGFAEDEQKVLEERIRWMNRD